MVASVQAVVPGTPHHDVNVYDEDIIKQDYDDGDHLGPDAASSSSRSHAASASGMASNAAKSAASAIVSTGNQSRMARTASWAGLSLSTTRVPSAFRWFDASGRVVPML